MNDLNHDMLRVPSVTGIDLELKIAGPGGRSYAFVIDWHFRFLLMLAWYVVGSLIYTGAVAWISSDDANFVGFVFVVVIPATAIYFLYHPVLEIAMRGRTPGKRIAGLCIVTTDGELPDVGALLIRNVMRLLDSLPLAYAIGLAATLVTRQSVRIGDLAAGTVLVYEDKVARDAIASFGDTAIANLGLDQTELVRELLDRWPGLAPETRRALGAKLLQRLGKPVATGAPDAELRAALSSVIA